MGRNRRNLLLAASLSLPLLAGCAAPPFDAAAVVREWAAYMDRDYVLKAGDKVALTVYQAEDLGQEVVVSPNGTVNLLRIPERIVAAGKTVGAFRREVQAAYSKVLQDAEVTVALAEASEKTIYVAGEVRRPGPIAYLSGMTLAQAISAAGGFDIRAKSSDVRVLRYYGKDRTRTYRVDTNRILYEGAPDFLLLPRDVVWCQTSGVADVNDVVTLYVRRMLPIPITGAAVPVGN